MINLVNKNEQQLIQWISEDAWRMRALAVAESVAKEFELTEYFLAAGFVRNLVWEKLHNYAPSPLNDVDFIYYDSLNVSIEMEQRIEQALHVITPDVPWSVKNQARMHVRNNDQAYASILDAISYWPEHETAVGVALVESQLTVISSFGLGSLFAGYITPNTKRGLSTCLNRAKQKQWLRLYPQLKIQLQNKGSV